MVTFHGAFRIITLPTRVTGHSQTILDNILTNNRSILLSGFVQTDISDQYIVFSIALNFSCFASNELGMVRNKTKFNTETYHTQLESNLEALNPHFVDVEPHNFNQLFEKFLNIVACMIEAHAPLQKLLQKQRKLQTKPWLTSVILLLNSIRHKQ